MIETIIVALIALAILGYHAWYVHESDKIKKFLVDGILAKSANEFRDLRLAENTKIRVEPKRQGEMPDLVPIEDLDDEAFMKASKETYG